MTEEKNTNFPPKYNPIDMLKNMGLFSKLCLVGAVLMLIDALLELATSPYGYLVLIFSVAIIIMATQMQDDNPYAYIYAIAILILTYICHFHFHVFVEIDWSTGLGYIGQILINIGASLALLLIVLSVAASVNRDPIRDIWLFFIGFALFGVNLLIYIIYIQNGVLTFTVMLTILYFFIICVCIVLMFLDQKLIGGLFIWIITLIVFISGLFSLSLSTPVTGFGAGLAIVGNIAGLYFINELGLELSKPKKK